MKEKRKGGRKERERKKEEGKGREEGRKEERKGRGKREKVQERKNCQRLLGSEKFPCSSSSSQTSFLFQLKPAKQKLLQAEKKKKLLNCLKLIPWFY